MRNKIILAAIIIIVGGAAIATFAYFSSFHKVSIDLDQDVTSATIHKEKGDEVTKLPADSDTSLQDGNYYIIPEGEKVAKDKIPFTVSGDGTILNINPDYSKKYLEDTLAKEQSAITLAATRAFPLIEQSYTMESGTLYKHGEWYGALLLQKDSDVQNERDFYRILIQKKAGEWKVINKPELVLTRSDFKDIPVEILTAINQLVE